MKSDKIVCLLGDSITEYLPYVLKEKLKPNELMSRDELKYLYRIYGVENIGIGYFHRYVWPHVIKDNVDYFIVLLGVNNLFRPDCDDDVLESIEEIFNKYILFIRDIQQTNKKLFVQSIYPTDRPNINNKIMVLNKMIQNYCIENNIDYIDMYSVLNNEENILNKKYSDDGIHPNLEGYQLILQRIEKEVLEFEKSVNIQKRLNKK